MNVKTMLLAHSLPHCCFSRSRVPRNDRYSSTAVTVRQLFPSYVSVDSAPENVVFTGDGQINISGIGWLSVLPLSAIPIITEFPSSSGLAEVVAVSVNAMAETSVGTNVSNATFTMHVAALDPAVTGRLFMDMSDSVFGWRAQQSGLVAIATVELVAAQVVESNTSISSNDFDVLVNGTGFSVIASLQEVQMTVVCGSSSVSIPNTVLRATAFQLQVRVGKRFPSDVTCSSVLARVTLFPESKPSGLSSSNVKIGFLSQDDKLYLEECGELSNCSIPSDATAVELQGQTFSNDTIVYFYVTTGRPIVGGAVVLLDIFTLQVELLQLGPDNDGIVQAVVCETAANLSCSAPTTVFYVTPAAPQLNTLYVALSTTAACCAFTFHHIHL